MKNLFKTASAQKFNDKYFIYQSEAPEEQDSTEATEKVDLEDFVNFLMENNVNVSNLNLLQVEGGIEELVAAVLKGTDEYLREQVESGEMTNDQAQEEYARVQEVLKKYGKKKPGLMSKIGKVLLHPVVTYGLTAAVGLGAGYALNEGDVSKDSKQFKVEVSKSVDKVLENMKVVDFPANLKTKNDLLNFIKKNPGKIYRQNLDGGYSILMNDKLKPVNGTVYLNLTK